MPVVAVTCERVAQDIGDAARHACAQVHSSGAENGYDSGRHVFASMLADTFDHRESAAVTHGKTLARPPGNVELARGRTIENSVANQHIPAQRGFVACGYGDGASTQTFANVIVRLAQQAELHARDEERPETLPSAACKFAGDDTGDSGAI